MRKIVGVVLLSIILCTAFVVPLNANEKESYKVAVMCCDDFSLSGDDNTFEEYIWEYLMRLSNEMGVEFEYDFIKSKVTEDVINQYDMYVGISKSTADKFNAQISSLLIFTDYLELWTLAENNTYAYNDFESFRGMRIGYIPNMEEHLTAVEILKAKNLDIEFVELNEDNYDDYCDKFANSGLDALVSVATRSRSDYSVIARFERQPIYIASSNAETMNKINEGMSSIEYKYPTFRFGVLRKYYGDSVYVSQVFTDEEMAYLNNHKTLNVYVHPDSGYLSMKTEDGYCGIEIDLLTEIAKIANVKLNIIDKITEKNFYDIDIFSSQANSEKFENGFYTTEEYLQANNYIIRDKRIEIGEVKKVALVEGDAYTKKYASKMKQVETITYYENIEKCFEAVLKGEADATFSNGYIIQYYLQYSKYDNLEMSIIEKQTELEFYIHENKGEVLRSIINKCIAQMGSEKIQEIVIRNTTSIDIEKTVWERFMENKFLVVLTILTMIVIVFIFIIAFTNRMILREDLKRAQFATKAKSDFLSRMSHDIRTPLNAIIGFNSIAREENKDPQVEANLEKIDTSSKYLLGLINDILDMSKIESGKLELNMESTNSLDFINEIASVFYELAKMKGIRLIADFSELKTVWVMMDSLRARQVYSNLLNNAIKFSEAGTCIEWKITDTIVDEDTTKRVVVIKDQGRGMSQEFMRTMFDPFEQEKYSYTDNESGTGLGLAIVKNILNLTGSKIEVESEVGKGTKFTITIIRKTGTPITANEMKIIEEKVEKEYAGKRLLLFEDHPLNRQIMIKLLEKKGIIVETAVNGKEGIDIYSSKDKDYYFAIFMDISMPIMNGYEAAKAIRAMEREDAKNIPIVAITANAFTEDVEKCLSCGMNAHISKPIDINKVYEVLDSL